MKLLNYKSFMLGAFACVALLTGQTSCSEILPTDDLVSVPIMGVEQESLITRTTATLVGTLNGNLTHVKEAGVKYSTSNAFPEDNTVRIQLPAEKIVEGSFSIDLTGLTPDTKYYYCWYVSTGAMELDSYVSEFTTPATEMTTFGELIVDSIGEDMARFRCSVEEIGDNYLIECGISYKKKNDPTFIPIACDSVPKQDPRTFTVELKNLDPNTLYIVRAYAKNSSDEAGNTGIKEGYSELDSITTQNLLSASMNILEPSDIGSGSAKITGKVLAAVGSNNVIEERGFCYSATNTYPTVADSKIIVEGTALNEEYTGTITGLEEGTLYYVRAYAKNIVDGKERYGYSETMQFTTTGLQLPNFENYNFNTTATEIEMTATISNYDENAMVERGIIWDKTNGEITLEEATEAGHVVKVDGKSKTFTGKITGLNPKESYYVRAYAIYQSGDNQKIGYSWGNMVSTAGFQIPSLDGPEVTEIGFFSAKLTGKISSNGNGKIIERGFCISTKTNSPTIGTSEIVKKADENFVATVDGLKLNTNYTVCSYVTAELNGEQETVYSYGMGFTTQNPELPSFSRFDNVVSTFSSITLTIEVMDLGDGESLVEKGICWLQSESWDDFTLDNCTGFCKSDDVSTGSSTYTMNNLKFNSRYLVKAYAKIKVGDTEVIGYSDTDSYNTQSISISWGNITAYDTSFEVSATFQNDMSEIDEYGFCVSDESLYGEPSGNIITLPVTNITENKEISGTITGLTSGKKYYLFVYAKDGETIGYAGGTERTTKRIPGADDNVSPDKKD